MNNPPFFYNCSSCVVFFNSKSNNIYKNKPFSKNQGDKNLFFEIFSVLYNLANAL
jgi:hypothetical protein